MRQEARQLRLPCPPFAGIRISRDRSALPGLPGTGGPIEVAIVEPVVVEVSTDCAIDRGVSRHPARLMRLRPDLAVDDIVEDVRTLLQYEDLHDAVLVGHSYGGMVITALCETDAAERIAHLIYLDALIPTPGDNAYDLMAPDITANLRRSVAKDGDGWRVPAHTGSGVFGLTDPDDVAWASARRSDQPAATYTQPLSSDAAAAKLPRHFIRFTDPAVIPDHVVDRARRDPSWHYSEVAAPHAGALSHPDQVAAALLATIGE